MVLVTEYDSERFECSELNPLSISDLIPPSRSNLTKIKINLTILKRVSVSLISHRGDISLLNVKNCPKLTRSLLIVILATSLNVSDQSMILGITNKK